MCDTADTTFEYRKPISATEWVKIRCTCDCNSRTGDAALDYRFYRFVPYTVKVLDEAEFGDAVWIQVQIKRRW